MIGIKGLNHISEPKNVHVHYEMCLHSTQGRDH